MFNRSSEALDVARSANLHGQVALVTGATSGLGCETARALAVAGADLVLCVRDPRRCAEIAEQLRQETGRRFAVHAMDLCDFASVRRAAGEIVNAQQRLDVFVANAGASKTPASHQQDGIDVRFAGNHLGHFLLANMLQPLMAERGARMVMLSSAAHRGRPVRLDDLAWTSRPHDEFAAYAESKSANILFAIEATRRWSPHGIFANAVLPGTVMTGLQRYHGEDLKRRMGFIDADGKPAEMVKSIGQGAATAVWAATAPELAGKGGMILEDCAIAAPHRSDMHRWSGYDPAILDMQTAHGLWERSREMLGRLGHFD